MNSAIERLLTLRVADVMQRHLVEVHETYDIASASQLPLCQLSGNVRMSKYFMPWHISTTV